MRRAPIIAFAIAALGGCNAAAPAGNDAAAASGTGRAPAVTAATLGIKPGKWEHTVEILDVQSPSMPPAVLAGLKARFNKADVATSDAAKGASAFLATPEMKKIGCHFDKAEMAGGRISTEMTCTMPSGKMTARSTGAYSATEYSVDGEIVQSGLANLTEKTRSSGRWLGACDAAGKAK
ncbi:MAG: DUF3617 family protein [Sphingomonas sp.]